MINNNSIISTNFPKNNETKKHIDWEFVLFIGICVALIACCVALIVLIASICHKDSDTSELIVYTIPAREVVFTEEKVEVAEVKQEYHAPILSDTDMIAAVVEAEARGESMMGKVAVALVVMNRADYYGLTVETVVNSKDQFAYNPDLIPSEESYRAVKIAQDNRDLLPEDVMWFRSGKYHDFAEPYITIGNHHFSRLGDNE